MDVCKVSKGALYRAEQAIKQGRDVGKNGPPTRLTAHQEAVLIEMIEDDYPKGDPPGCEEVCEMVSPRIIKKPLAFTHIYSLLSTR